MPATEFPATKQSLFIKGFFEVCLYIKGLFCRFSPYYNGLSSFAIVVHLASAEESESYLNQPMHGFTSETLLDTDLNIEIVPVYLCSKYLLSLLGCRAEGLCTKNM